MLYMLTHTIVTTNSIMPMSYVYHFLSYNEIKSIYVQYYQQPGRKETMLLKLGKKVFLGSFKNWDTGTLSSVQIFHTNLNSILTRFKLRTRETYQDNIIHKNHDCFHFLYLSTNLNKQHLKNRVHNG